jgi:hypothetical protein
MGFTLYVPPTPEIDSRLAKGWQVAGKVITDYTSGWEEPLNKKRYFSGILMGCNSKVLPCQVKYLIQMCEGMYMRISL